MRIEVYISELLYSYDCVIVPGFGGFVSNYTPAKIHPVLHTFLPPSKDILFNRNLKHNDGLLANHICLKNNTDFKHALEVIEEFVAETNAVLEKSRKITLPQIGTFYIDLNNVLQFRPDGEINYLISSFGFSEFVSPAIKRDDIQKRIEKKFADSRIIRSERKTGSFLTKAAIITIPVLALSVWGLINFSAIKDAYTSYSSLIPFLKNNNEITVPQKSMPDDNVFYSGYYSAFDQGQKFSFTNKEDEITVYDSNVIYTTTELDLKPIQKINSEPEAEAPKTNISKSGNDQKFFIIGSCFRSHDNAVNYKASLRDQGFVNADIIEPENGGLYKVFFDAFSSQEEANTSIKNIKQINSNVWIFRSK
jgi:hypothetical protein